MLLSERGQLAASAEVAAASCCWSGCGHPVQSNVLTASTCAFHLCVPLMRCTDQEGGGVLRQACMSAAARDAGGQVDGWVLCLVGWGLVGKCRGAVCGLMSCGAGGKGGGA